MDGNGQSDLHSRAGWVKAFVCFQTRMYRQKSEPIKTLCGQATCISTPNVEEKKVICAGFHDLSLMESQPFRDKNYQNCPRLST